MISENATLSTTIILTRGSRKLHGGVSNGRSEIFIRETHTCLRLVEMAAEISVRIALEKAEIGGLPAVTIVRIV